MSSAPTTTCPRCGGQRAAPGEAIATREFSDQSCLCRYSHLLDDPERKPHPISPPSNAKPELPCQWLGRPQSMNFMNFLLG